jgi:Resolvase, N terminal domain/Recombinase
VIAAYSYRRFSSASQTDNDSLARQMQVAREWYNREIAHLGIPLDETFTDSARSAYKGEHVGNNGDLGRFLAAIKSGSVSKGSILIAENLDRISRHGPKIARVILAKIVDNGVEVHIVNIGKKLTYGWENRNEDSIVVDIELSRAFKESERRSVVISAGLDSVKHSQDWSGILPFWLQKVDENGKKTKAKDGYKIVEITEQAALVREIFSLAANGLGAKRILQTLNAQGVNCSISLATVGSLLRDRSVLGEHQPHRYLESGRVTDGDPVSKFPKIVDQDQFNTVAARLDGKMKVCADGKARPATGNRYSHEANNLFEGLLYDVTDQFATPLQSPRSMTFQKKLGATNPFLISKWDAGRKSNRVRYDLFETDFLRYLKDEVDWKAVAGEKETEELKRMWKELDQVRSELDRANRLIARRSDQMNDPDLSDAVAKEFASQIVDTRSKVATLTELEYRLEGKISLESMKADALYSPEHLIALIRSGDPATRLKLRTELQRRISRISLNFASVPGRIAIVVRFINDVERQTEQRKPIKFTKPLHPRRAAAASLTL